MAKDAPAPDPPGDGINEGDYSALLATMSASERGRAFLAEYARRQRVAETEVLLAAITRVEAMIAARREPAAAENAPVESAAVAPQQAEKEPPEPPLARLRVIAQETQPIRPESPIPVPASAFAPAPITATSLAEVSWYAEDAPPADDGVRIRVTDDEPATAIADDQPATTIADDEVVTAVVENQPEIAVGNGEPATGAVEDTPAFATAPVVNIPDVPPIEAETDAAVTPPDADSAPVPLRNVLEQPAPSPANEPVQTAPSEAFKQVAPPARDDLEQPAPLMSEAADEPTPPPSDSFDHPAPPTSKMLEAPVRTRDDAPEQSAPWPNDTLAQSAPPSAHEPQQRALPRALMDQPAPSPGHPLAQLMALSDEERIALFS